MTVVAYPEHRLPLPLINPYGYDQGDVIDRTEMEGGEARHRQRSTTAPGTISVQWRFNAAQMALFEAWYRWKAREGAAWVSMRLLNGLGLESHEVRFKKPYTYKLRNGLLYDVTASLETRNRPTISADALSILLDEDWDGLLRAIETYHTTVQGEPVRRALVI